MSYPCYCNSKTSCRVTSVTSGVTSPCKAMLSTAVEEKQEMKSLNDQLACLVSRVRNVRQSSSSFDASSYRETITSLEEELVRVKNLYECEMSKLRQRLDDTSSCKASTHAMYESSVSHVSDLKAKLVAEAAHCEKLTTELSCTKSELIMVKKQLCDLSLTLQATKSSLDKASATCGMQTEIEETKCRLQSETCRRMEAEETIKSLREKLCFETRLREQNRCELEERLKSSTELVRSLEFKVKETSEPSFDYAAVLEKLRAGTASELERYKLETDEALNRNLYALRQQIDSEKSVREGLTTEKSRMEHIIAELRTRIADSEGQMAGLIKQRDALEMTLRSERTRATGQIRDLEIKLSEINDVMLAKVKECTNAREAQVSLKTEIDAFKVLLQEGEKRLTTPCTTTSKLVDIDTTLSLGHTYNHCYTTHTADTDLYIAPRPPPTPRRRPTSAHASCYQAKTRIAPVDDRVFHCHANTEYRTSAGSGACTLNNSSKYHMTSIDDLDLHKSYNASGKRVTVEFQPDAIKRVTMKEDFGVCGKGISTCFAPSFPKNSYCDSKCIGGASRKGYSRCRTSYNIY